MSLFTPCVNLYSKNAEFPCLKFALLSLVMNMAIVLKKKDRLKPAFQTCPFTIGKSFSHVVFLQLFMQILDEVDERRWYCWSLQ